MVGNRLNLKATTFTKEQMRQQLSLLETQKSVEIAFAGRSNVGKSSLVNALAGRRKLAKISGSPGKTRSLNFYAVEPTNLVIVDLPGYGYARRSQSERLKWAELIESYLLESKGLRRLVLLLDCRVPTQRLDHNLILFSRELRLPITPVLTKIDKCSLLEQSRKQRELTDLFEGEKPALVSSKTMKGIEELWRALFQAAGLDPSTQAKNTLSV